MRPSLLVLATLLIACAGAETDKPAASTAEPDKAPTAAEREAETDGKPDRPDPAIEARVGGAARDQCVATCIEAKVMEAKAAEAIEADCRAKCDDA